jgi:hypothetical protein
MGHLRWHRLAILVIVAHLVVVAAALLIGYLAR